MPSPDFNTIARALRELYPAGSVIEVRRLSAYRGATDVGYFNDPVLAANVITHSDHDGIAGTYATLNPVPFDALARCANRMTSVRSNNGLYTNDREIEARRGILMDFDPERLSGISSTDEEHENALRVMRNVAIDLSMMHGFPQPFLIDSGNGGHIRYITEPVENNDEATWLFRTFLQAAAKVYSAHGVKLDTTVWNASRISRVPGTVARKGEHTPNRPHRVSRLLQSHDPLDVLTVKRIKSFIEFVTNQPAVYTPKAKPVSSPGAVYPEDERLYRNLNDVARQRLHDWVPRLIGDIARPANGGQGYRISSDDLGRDLEEDISIHPEGIKDFGLADMGDPREGRRTPIELVSQLLTNGDKAAAARMLSAALNTPINEFEGYAIAPPQPAPQQGPSVPGVAIDPFTLGEPQQYATVRKADVSAALDTPVDYVVKNVLPAGNHVLLSAKAKMGKTILAMQMAICVAHGIDFLDRKVKQGSVLYVAFETSAEQFNRDLKEQRDALFEAMGINMPIEESNSIIAARINVLVPEHKANVRIRDGEAGIAEIIHHAKQIPELKLVVVDIIRDLWEKRNLVSRDLVEMQRQQIMEVGRIASQTGAALLSLHHERKSNANDKDMLDATERAGGTSAMSSATDGNCYIMGFKDTTSDGKQPPRAFEGYLRNGTFKRIVMDYTCSTYVDEDGDEQPRKGVFFRLPDDTEVPLGKETAQAGRKRNEAQDMGIITYITDNQPVTVKSMALALNGLEATIRYRLKRLVREGRLVENVLDFAPFGMNTGGKGAAVYTLAGWKVTPDGKLVLDRPHEIPQLPDLALAAI